jgi:hypothetical protein
MSQFSRGKYSQFISDRSGLAFPYNEMVVEWTGARVHTSEYEPKSAQVSPRPHGADPQALPHARPRSPSIPTADLLLVNPITTNSNTTVNISYPTNSLQVLDFVRLVEVKENVGGVALSSFQPSSALSTNISATDTSATFTSTANFPTSGYFFIQSFTTPTATQPNQVPISQPEIIKYTANNTGTNTLSGFTRATNAPYRGTTPSSTKAYAHSAGTIAYASFEINAIITTTQKNPGMPATVTVNTGFTFILPNAATGSATGGGNNIFVSPVGGGIV